MADRIGVIRRGEIILVEEKAALMRKLGRKQLTLHLAEADRRRSRRSSPITAGARRRAARELVYTYDTTRRAHRHHRPADRPGGGGHPVQRPPHRAEFAGGHLRRPRREGGTGMNAIGMNWPAVRAIYRFEMAPLLAHRRRRASWRR